MARVLRAVPYDVEHVAQFISFDGLSPGDQQLIRSLGLPGTENLFDDDPDVAEAAKRKFARSFFGAGSEDE